jgi:ABC-type Fe3+-hydroxamate transport system substrate-binding protein
MRVVSCVPSLSELAEELRPGCLVGRTRFCIAPDSLKKVPKVGGTKDLDTAAIIRLKPDLVLSVKEENEKQQIGELISAGIETAVFDIRTLEDALAMVQECGKLLQNPAQANRIAAEMNKIREPAQGNCGSMLYFIWQKPWMVAGEDTFIGDLLRKTGFRNLAPPGARYPAFQSIEQILQLNPDVIFLSDEPFPFNEKHRVFFQNNFPRAKVFRVDGSLFSWYGSRTAKLNEYLRNLSGLNECIDK